MKNILKTGAVLALFALPMMVMAAVSLPVTVPEGTGLTMDKIAEVINTVANWLMIIGVVIAVIYIVWGGIKYMTDPGDKDTIGSAWAKIKGGVIGLIIILAVGVIIRTATYLVTRQFFGAGQ